MPAAPWMLWLLLSLWHLIFSSNIAANSSRAHLSYLPPTSAPAIRSSRQEPGHGNHLPNEL